MFSLPRIRASQVPSLWPRHWPILVFHHATRGAQMQWIRGGKNAHGRNAPAVSTAVSMRVLSLKNCRREYSKKIAVCF